MYVFSYIGNSKTKILFYEVQMRAFTLDLWRLHVAFTNMTIYNQGIYYAVLLLLLLFF